LPSSEILNEGSSVIDYVLLVKSLFYWFSVKDASSVNTAWIELSMLLFLELEVLSELFYIKEPFFN
jgi:hypothetical protein